MRKWLVRVLVFSVLAGLALAGLIWQRWTNPAAVRQAVVDRLGEEFAGAAVSLESAELRLLGGIAVSDLRLARRDDPDRVEFLSVPSAVLYHDKESLLEGKLEIRKVELFRPRLRLVRNRAGAWNLADLLGPSELSKRLPTIVVRHGTVLLEDQQCAAGTAPLELRDVNVTVLNDPLPTLTFDGHGVSELVGEVRVRGGRQRESGEATASLTLPAVQVGPELIQRLAAFVPEAGVHARQLEAVGRVQAEVAYTPGADKPLRYDVQCQLSQGKLTHAQVPLPLEKLEASIRCVDGRIPTVDVTARSGTAKVHLHARDLNPFVSVAKRDTDKGGPALKDLVRDLTLRVEHLAVTPTLFPRLPEALRATIHDAVQAFDPQGLATVQFTFQRQPSGPGHKRCVVKAEGGRASFVKFPCPLEHITGTLEADFPGDAPGVVRLNLAGKVGERPVYVQGELTGPSPMAVKVDVWGKDIALDDKVIAALPAEHQALAREFRPTARGDFKALVYRPRNARDYANRYEVTFRQGTIRYKAFPYPLENISGTLEMGPGGWVFRDFRGSHKGGSFTGYARSLPGARAASSGPPGETQLASLSNAPPRSVLLDPRSGMGFELGLKGSNILLDEEMAAALEPEPELKRTWQAFGPAGRIDFEGKVVRLPGHAPDIDLTVYPQGCRIRPAFFRYDLNDLRGKVRYARRWVELEKLSARHGGTTLSLGGGKIYLKEDGGVWGDLLDLEAQPLVPDEELVSVLPGPIQKACRVLQLRDPVFLKTRLVLDSAPEGGGRPVVYWDGIVSVRQATLTPGVKVSGLTGEIACRGSHDGHHMAGMVGNINLREATLLNQPLRNLQTRFEVTKDAPEVLRLPGLHCDLYGGEVYGPMCVEFGSNLRYRMKLTASRINLEEFGRNNLGGKARIQGQASAQLYLEGQGTDLSQLAGSGTVEVPSGKLYNLPVLLDLLKVLGLRVPDRTAFEEAKAQFDVKGPRVYVNSLELFGNVISLRGQGEMNLDGSDLNLDFHADWGRITQTLPPGLRKIPPAIGDQLLKIEMRGSLGAVRCKREPVPVLLDPVKKLLRKDPPARTRASEPEP